MTFPLTSAFFKKSGGGSCPSYTPGLYTAEEIDDLVNVDGYIPVASADEFDAIRTGVSETMGAGTCWEDSYTTGGDKKYVQVGLCDFTSFGTFTSANQITTLTGFVYDGNELLIDNVTSTRELFNAFSIGGAADLKNIRVVNMSFVKDTGTNGAGIVDVFRGGNIINCHVINSSLQSGGALGGIISRITPDLADVTVQDCYVNNISFTSNANDGTGGIIGRINGATFSVLVTENRNDSDIDTIRENVGGIAGNVRGTVSMTKNTNTGDITGTQRVSGIAGNITCQTFEENKNTGNITGTVMVGGMIGNLEMTSVTFLTFRNLESSGLITASGSESGGLVGRIRWGGNVFENSIAHCTFAGSTTLRGGIAGRQFSGATTNTQTYWDTTIGPATSASTSGTGQTTTALQTPTSNTGIYSAWTIPPWDFGTSSDYPTLTTTP